MVKNDGSFRGIHPRGVLPFGKLCCWVLYFFLETATVAVILFGSGRVYFYANPITLSKQTSIKHNRTPEWDGGKGRILFRFSFNGQNNM
ncbi:hypothetical protein CEXT_695441 [Caerostris extrusa]|uniref:Uncharacterized protein n=1 Tax=Caerostris extrusa TaxID=172846 RepID=A0AAV4R3C9_CAEEX|nr:hypothetical protein CEXT_695441 [Caerostris extrusa]